MLPHLTTILQRCTGAWALLLPPDAVPTVWLTALGIQAHLVLWWQPQTCPSWLTRYA